MSQVSINQLPSATSLTAADLVPVMQGGATKQATVAEIVSASGYQSLRIPVGADPTGIADSTSVLQSYINALVTNGDPGYLPPGTYKVSDTLVASGTSLILSGAGSNRTIINLTASSKPVLRLNITGDGVGTPCGYVADLGVRGPAANPTDFSAGFLFDACRGFNTVRTDAGNTDIGYDFVNNCFNSSLFNPSCHRFNSCNVGINLRGFDTQFESGNDISVYDAILSNKLAAVIVGPNSGGFHFFGGQFGTSGLASNRDDLACIMLGVQYDSVVQTGTGSLTTGGCTADFNGLSLEGINREWFIQTYDEVTVGFYNMGFTPSASGAAAALGILKCQNWKNSQMDFGGVLSIQAGGVLQTAIASFAGGGSAGMIREGPWQQGSLTVNGSGVSTRTMVSLAASSTTPQVGLGSARRSSLINSILGNLQLRPSLASGAAVLQFSVDGGSTWNAV